MQEFDPFDETRRDDPAWIAQFKSWSAHQNSVYEQSRRTHLTKNPPKSRDELAETKEDR